MKNIVERISDYALEEIMGERFGRYCKTIIQNRAIPDVRDGLKPVQRRILYSMYREKNTYDKPYHKSARALGPIIGKYHPHGDSSIYEAMVRMSQSWKMKNPYIDMHGNNGSIDGDSPAAYRYTESRLSKISEELLKDIDKNTVIFSPNYDDSLLEPTVLPAKYPNLLVNGAMGISAGYATNIPPHNLGEIVDATIYRIDHPDCLLDNILELVKGPDFPTGGIVEGKEGLNQAYKTGRGKIIVKAKYIITKDQIIINEIPYEVNKASLISRINDIRIDKKIEGMVDARDESDKEGLRIVIDLKKDANKDIIINYLLKNTELQISFNFNMVAIVDRHPRLLGILSILDSYLSFQKEVILNRTHFDLDHFSARLHIVEGMMKALDILDEVIKTIRSSKNKADAQENLVREYDFTMEQAVAIVMLQLYRLTNTDVKALQEEQTNLLKLIAFLNKILSDKTTLKKVMKDELLKIKKEYDVERLTEIRDEITEIKIDTIDLIPKEDVIVAISKDGYVKRVSNRSYSASEGETLLKDGDYLIGLYKVNTLDTVLLFTDLGNYLYVPVYEIPDTKWKDLGKHISNLISLSSEENIIYSLPVSEFTNDEQITFFTKNGMIKRTNLSEFKVSRYSKAMSCLKLKDKDKVIKITNEKGNNILVITKNGYALNFKTEEVSLVGIKASGVKAISLKADQVVGGHLFDEDSRLLAIFTDKGTGKRIKLTEIDTMSRTRKGIRIIKDVKTNPHSIITTFLTESRNSFGVIINDKTITLKASEVTIMDKNSIGSTLIKGKIKAIFEEQSLEETKVVEESKEVEQLSLLDVDKDLKDINNVLKDIKID
ncbi:MAG: DNA topoisomerase IV subunit A [Mollicutes bacterium]|nr:DNA topoisomerase IV subunit A [Mollicutes bacterium]